MCGPPPFGELRVLALGSGSHFLGPQESCPPQKILAWIQNWPIFIEFPELAYSNRQSARAMRGDLAAQGRHLLDGAWSCIPENAQSSVDFIAELKSSILPNFSMIRPAAEILMRYALAAT